MSSVAVTVLCIAAFAVCITVSFVKKMNVGVLSMACAYIIGCFIMKLSVREVIDLFPVKIFFLLFSVSFFYSYSIQNGTMQVIADKIIFRFQKRARLLPFFLYFLAFFLGVMGASAPSVAAILAPICIAVSEGTGIHYMIMLILICLGGTSGSLVPWGQGGLIIRGVAETAGIFDSVRLLPEKVCINMLITGLIAVFVVFIIYKGYKAKEFVFEEKVKGFTKQQKTTLVIICIVLAAVLLPGLIAVLTKNPTAEYLSRVLDIQMLSIIGAAVCAALRLGNEREILVKGIPWNTIMMACGVCMLLGIVTKTGILETFADAVSGAVSERTLCIILVLLGGFMSLFSGAMSVVVPMILPVVMQIVTRGNYAVLPLTTSLVIGAIMTCTSPFSTAGSFVLSCVQDEGKREEYFGKQFIITIILFFVPIILAAIGAYGIL